MTLTSGGPGSAYAWKGREITTTSVTLRYVTDGWRLVGAEKVSRWSDSKDLLLIRISEADRADILRQTLEDITVHAAAA